MKSLQIKTFCSGDYDLAALIAQTDVTTVSKIKTLIDAAQNMALNQGLKQEISVFDCHIKDVLNTDIEIPRS